MAPQDCVFCRVVRGDLPTWKIAENNTVLGFLDSAPCAEGHCLIIPKRHVRFWHDLDEAETRALFDTAKTVARQIAEVFKPDFVCIFARGGRVKHAHIVLFPSHEGDGISGFPQSVLGTPKISIDKVWKKLIATRP